VNEKGTFWIDGVLTESLRKGYWYLADEINASNADINFVYHSLLDDDGFIVLPENGGEIVRPHENFRFFGAMNPSADYVGVKELNKALLSRFIVLKTDFPNPAVEEKILVKRTGIKSEIAKKMIAFANEIRQNHQKDKISFVFSTRELLSWCSLYKIYGKYIPSAEITVLNKVNDDDFESVKDLLSLHFRTLDNPKAKAEPKEETKEETEEETEETNN
jgi:cobaltochelatase CobS